VRDPPRDEPDVAGRDAARVFEAFRAFADFAVEPVDGECADADPDSDGCADASAAPARTAAPSPNPTASPPSHPAFAAAFI